jgi:hypothetical protein
MRRARRNMRSMPKQVRRSFGVDAPLAKVLKQ